MLGWWTDGACGGDEGVWVWGGGIDAVFHSVKPGQYISAGRQGTRRLGQLEKVQVPNNPDILNYEAFKLKHQVRVASPCGTRATGAGRAAGIAPARHETTSPCCGRGDTG